jgi:hypothetical protein
MKFLSPVSPGPPSNLPRILHSSNRSKGNVPDLNLPQTSLVVLVQVHVDGEMGVNVSHLVLEALCDTDNQVVDESSDCAEGSNILAGAVVKLDVDDILLWVGEVDCEMAEVLGELALGRVRCATFSIRYSVPYLEDPRLLLVST